MGICQNSPFNKVTLATDSCSKGHLSFIGGFNKVVVINLFLLIWSHELI